MEPMRLCHVIAFLVLSLWITPLQADMRGQPASDAERKPVSFWDHREKVVTVAFSPDGKTLLTGEPTGDGLVAVWDLATMNRKALLTDTGVAYHIVFSPDGLQFALAGEAQAEPGERRGGKPTLTLRDAATGKVKRTFALQNGEARHVAFSPDGKLLASADEERTVTLWDVATGKPRAVLNGHEAAVTFVAFSPDGKTLASAAGYDGSVRLWDVATGKQRLVLTGHKVRPLALAFSRDGKVLVSGGDLLANRPGEVKRWDVATGKELAPIKGVEGPSAALALSPDGKLLAFADRDGYLTVQDWQTGKTLAQFCGMRNFRQIAFSPDSKTLAAVSLSGEPPVFPEGVRLWDLPTGKEQLSPAEETERDRREALALRRRVQQAQARQRRTPETLLMEATANARRTQYALTMNQAQQAWERWEFVRVRELLESLSPAPGQEDLRGFEWYYLRRHLPRRTVLHRGEDDYASTVAISRDGESVAMVIPEGEERNVIRGVQLFSTATGKQRALLKGTGEPIHSVCFSPDCNTLAVSEEEPETHDSLVQLWDHASGRLLGTLRSKYMMRNVLSFSPDGKLLAVAGLQGSLQLWDVQRRTLFHTFAREKNTIHAVAFSPDGKTIAAGIEKGPTRLWDVETGKEKGTLPHLRDASAVAFAPHTRQVATAHNETTVLWDTTTFQPIASFKGEDTWPLLWTDQGQLLMRGLVLYEPLSGRERACLLKPEPPPDRRKDSPQTLGTDDDILRSFRRGETGVVGRTLLIEGGPRLVERVAAIVETSSGRLLVVTRGNSNIRLLDFPPRLASHRWKVPSGTGIRLAFSANGRDLLARVDNMGVRRWDSISGRDYPVPLQLRRTGKAEIRYSDRPFVRIDGLEVPLADFAALSGRGSPAGELLPLEVLALSPDGRTLVTSVMRGVPLYREKPTVVLRDAATGKERCQLTGFKELPAHHQLAFSRDGKTLTTWTDDVVTWDTALGKEVDRIEPPAPVVAVRFAEDGKTPMTLLLRESQAPSLHLWDVATGEVRRILRLHPDFVEPDCVAFFPGGRLIATAGHDKAVRIWDARTGDCRFVLRGHPHAINCIAIRQDSKAVAAASSNGTVTIWNAEGE
jgi:WD40 repeat protein